MWKQAFVSTILIWKNFGEIQIKGSTPGEIKSQGGKDVDCAVSRR